MSDMFVLPIDTHNKIVQSCYIKRGYDEDESLQAAKLCAEASTHGIRTHNAIKALHLEESFGSSIGGCTPGAKIEVIPSKYKAVQKWNANKKLGQAVAYAAMDEAMKLADEFGVGCIAVDNAFHYLWGGGYVIEAARKGYIAYTCCTSTLSEVVPFGGKYPTLGTNPHSWAFPTTDAVGFPVCVDWATSTIATGRVQQLAREGAQLPPNCAVDKDGNPTQDPTQCAALLPFGAHKGYGLSLLDELYAAYTGGSLPTLRGRPMKSSGEKNTCTFYFQVVKADAIDCGNFAQERSQSDNVKAVLDDILGHGNDLAILPGFIESKSVALTKKHGGLLFSAAEIEEFEKMAAESGVSFSKADLQQVTV